MVDSSVSSSLDGDVSQGARGEDELVQAAKEGAHEGVGLSDIDLTAVVKVKLGPGARVELAHIGLHLGLGELLGDEHDLGASLLAAVLIEDLLASLLAGGVGDLNGVVVEDVVHDIILIGTEVARGRSVGGGRNGISSVVVSGGGANEGEEGELHIYYNLFFPC